MPKRKRPPVRRVDGVSRITQPKQSRQAQDVLPIEEDASNVQEQTNQLMKNLGLDEGRWQPVPPVPATHTPAVIRLHIANTTEDQANLAVVGRIAVHGDAAGISTILADHVFTSSVEVLLLCSYSGSCVLQVTAIIPSYSLPLTLHSQVSLSVHDKHCPPSDIYESRTFFQYHLAFTTATQLLLLVVVPEKLIETEGADSYRFRNVQCITRVLKMLHPQTWLDQVEETPRDVNNELSRPLSITEQIRKFYHDVKTHQQHQTSPSLSSPSQETVSPLSSIPHLTAVLLNYQKDALRWMLGREKEAQSWAEEQRRQGGLTPLHILWREIRGDLSQPFYYNPFTGKFSLTRYTMPLPPRGGILADEMGLGKTVEILALILSHQWYQSQFELTTECSTITYFNGTECGNGSGHQTSVNGQRLEEVEQADVVWCVCGVDCDTEGEEFVCCEVCATWQHTRCVDYCRTIHQDYTCIRCLLKQPHPCGTTLIIVPETLLCQWMEEIAKHTDMSALSVLIYKGVASHYHNPLHLAKYDIIMVTYETLRRELDRVHHNEFSCILRHHKRYTYPPSPLLALCWWRVCLDEAQTVETTNAKAAEMTHKLSAINRWCVTGTPIQRHLGDLYGLVYFLNYSPYCTHHWYNRLIWQPFLSGNHTPILSLFAKLMWRNTKTDVADELHIPEQREEIHWLTFSPVEAYYYNRQRELCAKLFASAVSQLEADTVVADLRRSTMSTIMSPLHSLRQACCHPQLVKGGYIPFSSKNHCYITMDELLNKLEVQSKQEGREHLRLLVMSLNGVAAIHILKNEWQLAVDTYREAMSCWKEHDKRFDCDKLQQIHTMENLSALLKEGHSALSRSVADDRLESMATELRKRYLKKAEVYLKAQVTLLLNSIQQSLQLKYEAIKKLGVYFGKEEEEEDIDREGMEEKDQDGKNDVDDEDEEEENKEEHKDDDKEQEREKLENMDKDEEEEEKEDEEEEEEEEDVDNEAHDSNILAFWETTFVKDEEMGLFSSQPWWVYAVSLTVEQERESALLVAVQTELANTDYGYMSSLRDLSGLQFWLTQESEHIEMARSEILHVLQSLTREGTLSPEYVAAVCDCHVRPNLPILTNQCDFCNAEDLIHHYEMKIFQRYFGEDEDFSRRESMFEAVLSHVLSFIKKGSAKSTTMSCLKLIEAGKLHMSYMENIRKEFKHIRSVWIAAESRVRTYDELAMATQRLRLATLEETVIGVKDPVIVLPYEVDAKMMGFKGDIASARQALKKTVSQLGYLHNLSVARGNGEREACPICCIELSDKWVVLPCSHSVCMECTYVLLKLRRPGYVSSNHLPPLQIPSNHYFNCPLCRKPVVSSELNFIQTSSDSQSAAEAAVKGSHSTKITAVTATLCSLKANEPAAKSLVFSSKYEVLQLISRALKANGISYTFLVQKTDFQRNLKKFKSSPSLNVALMLFSSGSKGLNIVEATHVLLVEPLLNIGSELQAIGRVHRVGQTRPTTVHRYYVKDTVETKIKEMLSNSVDVDKFISSETGCTLSVAELQRLLL